MSRRTFTLFPGYRILFFVFRVDTIMDTYTIVDRCHYCYYHRRIPGQNHEIIKSAADWTVDAVPQI